LEQEKMVILAETKVKTALDAHPELKDVLIALSPKFKKLNNPLLFKAVSHWATFHDVAKIGGISICQILHTLNREIGSEGELFRRAPECSREITSLNSISEPVVERSFTKVIPFDVRQRDDYFLPELTQKVKALHPDEALKIISDFDPIPLKRMLDTMNYSYSTDKIHEDLYETYIFKSSPDSGQNG
jgi:NitT/TauT family transport system substrate-binding protein